MGRFSGARTSGSGPEATSATGCHMSSLRARVVAGLSGLNPYRVKVAIVKLRQQLGH